MVYAKAAREDVAPEAKRMLVEFTARISAPRADEGEGEESDMNKFSRDLVQGMKEATAFGNGQSVKENDDALAEIKKSGKTEIDTLTPEQDAAMRKAMEPVYKDVATRVGQPLIDEFVKETGGVSH